MNSHERDLGKVFKNTDKTNIGKTREVYKSKGVESVGFIVKEKRSEEELQALRFLSEIGISEKLLIYDEKKLVLEQADGGYSQNYLKDLIHGNPDKITESESTNTQSGPRLKITGWSKEYVPENAITKDERIRKFFVDYLSKLLFLILTGVLHNDIQISNIFVNKGGNVKFIDFGEVSIVDSTKELGAIVNKGIINLFKGLELMQVLNPVFSESAEKIKGNEEVRNILRNLYTQYHQRNIRLANRIDVVEKL